MVLDLLKGIKRGDGLGHTFPGNVTHTQAYEPAANARYWGTEKLGEPFRKRGLLVEGKENTSAVWISDDCRSSSGEPSRLVV